MSYDVYEYRDSELALLHNREYVSVRMSEAYRFWRYTTGYHPLNIFGMKTIRLEDGDYAILKESSEGLTVLQENIKENELEGFLHRYTVDYKMLYIVKYIEEN